MRRGISLCLTVGWICILASGSLAQTTPTRESGPSLRFTIYIRNYARVEEGTLILTERVAAEIFRKIGVESSWAIMGPEIAPSTLDRIAIELLILPRVMAERLGLPDRIFGIVPGTDRELSRRKVYVFYDEAERLAQEQIRAWARGHICRYPQLSQILGYAIAHEFGHVFLGLGSHAPIGIMRAKWDRKDLYDIVTRHLLFTPQQARQIRAEVALRNQEQTTLKVSAPKSPEWPR